MEKCVFCGNTRKSAPYIRFFAVPREPGLKRIQWLYALGDKEMGPKDRVCGLHFRQGRPSSDPSHEDFVPHLYLNREPPEEILNYLESLDDSRNARTSVAGSSSTSSDVAVGQASGKNKPTNSRDAFESGRPTKNVRAPKPSILQRKRKQRFDDNQRTQNPSVQEEWNLQTASPSKIHILHKSVAQAVGARHGQVVIVRRLVPVTRREKLMMLMEQQQQQQLDEEDMENLQQQRHQSEEPSSQQLVDGALTAVETVS